jgi:hypothetical protein
MASRTPVSLPDRPSVGGAVFVDAGNAFSLIPVA